MISLLSKILKLTQCEESKTLSHLVLTSDILVKTAGNTAF